LRVGLPVLEAQPATIAILVLHDKTWLASAKARAAEQYNLRLSKFALRAATNTLRVRHSHLARQAKSPARRVQKVTHA
jgi:hypothetical protein